MYLDTMRPNCAASLRISPAWRPVVRSTRVYGEGVLTFILALVLLPQVATETPITDDPDRLYADREHFTSGERAAAIWEARLVADPNDYEAAWKLARCRYWLGGHVPQEARQEQYEKGVDAGERAAKIEAARPEGHFWLAANMGALAEGFGTRLGLRYRSPIKDELETVLRIDSAFQQGSADRGLGRWYFKVPGLLGGSKDKAVEHLRKSLEYNPNSTATHFFLGEVLLDMKRKDEARAELQTVIDAPLDPDWTPEDREWKYRATELLKTLDR